MHYAISSYNQQMPDAEVLRRFGHLVRRAALALASRTGADPDDLWSVGALGLLEAARRFDASQGVTLEAFVSWRIRGAMLDELRRMDRLPRRMRGRLGAVQKARHELQQSLGRPPTREELAAATGEDAATLDRLDEANEKPAQIDEVHAVAAEGSLEQLMVDQERAGELRAALATLPERQQTVLSLRYVEEFTLKEIAGVLGVSEPRVCQIHNAAVIKLRQILP
jgi:RNA polymerase sigma factor for flagellar operon FliA